MTKAQEEARVRNDAILLTNWLNEQIGTKNDRYVRAIAAMHTQSAIALLAFFIAHPNTSLPELSEDV